eukprot:1322647-Prymnesium_polylepis.1
MLSASADSKLKMWDLVEGRWDARRSIRAAYGAFTRRAPSRKTPLLCPPLPSSALRWPPVASSALRPALPLSLLHLLSRHVQPRDSHG